MNLDLYKAPKHVLPVIVMAQFCCTSLWFAGNGVMPDIIENFGLSTDALSHLTSAVQLGFIIGTLVFAILSLADRFSPSKVFFICALVGAGCNLLTIMDSNDFGRLILIRFITGFSLAGIYPVGMKIASDYFDKGLGKSLGYLVGALVMGTALPHLLKYLGSDIPWTYVIFITSGLAAIGGLLIYYCIPDGPYRSTAQKLNPRAIFSIFRSPSFRRAAVGYFGHMWELYTFWAFTPIILSSYLGTSIDWDISLLSFVIIGIGGVSCVLGGYIAGAISVKKVAYSSLLLSSVCCLISPIVFLSGWPVLFIIFMIFWGMVVISDSPMFSTLVAQAAPIKSRATALTIVNCIGFSITICSIQLINLSIDQLTPIYAFTLLAIGPIIGLINSRL